MNETAVKDVTDATFQTEVIDRSAEVAVVVDLWAPWCGPCKTLGPIIENVIGATGGKVELAKVNVDENPGVAQAFQVQGIPAVYALRDGKVVDGFVGAQPEPTVQAFVDGLMPTEVESEIETLVAAGDEASLRRALELEPGNEAATVALAALLVDTDRADEALELLETIPESAESRHVAALARSGRDAADGADAKLDELLAKIAARTAEADEARQEFVDILELLGPDDPRTAEYRRRLTSALY